MTSPLGDNVWVFHAGALGDHVMIWPLVRALARQGARVTVVTATAHARLCEEMVGGPLRVEGAGLVVGLSAENRRYTGLWAGRAATGAEVENGVTSVLSFVADDTSEAGRQWMGAASTMFPGARVSFVDAPGTRSRREVWDLARVSEYGGVAARAEVGVCITMFVGAGGSAKRWPLERFGAVVERLREERIGGTSPIILLSGPVEREKFSAAERELLGRMGMSTQDREGEFGGLLQRMRWSRVFVGADTGPTQLAAQLGVPTIALFGPTDPATWSPIGPSVRVVAPPRPCAMEWLSVERVAAEIASVLATSPA